MNDDATNTAALEAPARTLPDTPNSLLAVGAHVGGLFTCVLVPIIIFLIARSDAKLAYAT